MQLVSLSLQQWRAVYRCLLKRRDELPDADVVFQVIETACKSEWFDQMFPDEVAKVINECVTQTAGSRG